MATKSQDIVTRSCANSTLNFTDDKGTSGSLQSNSIRKPNRNKNKGEYCKNEIN